MDDRILGLGARKVLGAGDQQRMQTGGGAYADPHDIEQLCSGADEPICGRKSEVCADPARDGGEWRRHS
jgi:hypothetical protein